MMILHIKVGVEKQIFFIKSSCSNNIKECGLTPIENPYTYIKESQSSFDYTQLKFYKEYYENLSEEEAELIPPEWKVYL